MMNNCEHKVIYDQHTNDHICHVCGLIMEEQIVFSDWEKKQVSFNDNTEQSISHYVIDLISDVCANRNIHDGIRFAAIQMASKMRSQRQNNILAAYCVYMSLLSDKNPRLVQEVASHFGVTSKHLWSYIVLHNNYFIHELKPSDLSATIFSELDVPYKLGKEINALSDDLSEDQQFAPSSVLCAVLLHMMKRAIIPATNPKTVAFICGVSLSTARRVKKHLNLDMRRLGYP